jgi:hypothetical protein
MKRFLFHILLFTVVLVVLFTLITIVTDKGLRRSESGNLKEWNDIFAGKINSDIIIQGSSRAWVQFDTYIIDSVLHANSYNFGMDGSPFDVQFVRYKAYVAHNAYPKLIIQNVDWDLLDKNTSVYQKYQLLPFLNDTVFKEQLLAEKLLPKTDIYLPLFRYSGQTKAIQLGFSEFFGLKHVVSEKHKGFAGASLAWDGKNFGKKKLQGKIEWKINPEVEKQFIEFLLDCQQKKIKVLLVHAPVYYEHTKLFTAHKELVFYYKTLAHKYDAYFLDLSEDSLSFSKSNFYNVTHLNKSGSELFTIKLTRRMKEMGLLNKE